MTVNIIICDIRGVNAIVECTEELDTYNIYVRDTLPQDRIHKAVVHELSHIHNDDFHVDHQANLIETMIRMRDDEDDTAGINFYYHHTTLNKIRGLGK